MLRRTLGGYARHPNFGALLVVGLGCETNQISGLMRAGRPAGKRTPAHLQHPGHRRHGEDRGARHRAGRVDARRGQPRAAPAGAGQPHHGRPAVRRLRRLLAASAPTRRSARRSTGWCATAAPPSCPRSPEIYGGEHLLTRRAVSQAVADKLLARLRWWERLLRAQRRRDGQQPVGRQQGRRADHDPRKEPGRDRQERHHQPGRRVRVRAAGHGQGPGVHGHARLRPGVGHRPGGRRRQPDLLHHRPRLGLRLRAVAVAEALAPTPRCG